MTMLIHWLWQGVALSFGLALVLRCSRSVNAATRYALWWLALGAVLVLPIIGPAAAWIADTAGADGRDTGAPTIVARPSATAADSLVTLPAAPDWLLACAVGLWFGTVLVGGGRLVAAVRTVDRLKTDSQPVTPAVARALRLWMATTRRPADLRTSRTIAGACALGLAGRPTIVVSRTLAASLDADALDLIVLHEQLHLSRYDDWSRLGQSVLVMLFGLHPAVRFISRQLDIEREAACDEAVAVRAGDARRYASCLADVADVITGRQALVAPLVVPNAAGSGLLLTRVQRLLDPGIALRARVRGAVVAAASVLLAAGSLAVTAAGPRLVAEVVDADPLPRPSTVDSTVLVQPAGSLPSTPVPLMQADAVPPVTRRSPDRAAAIGIVPGVDRQPSAVAGATTATNALLVSPPELTDELEAQVAPLPSVELPRVTIAPGAKQNVAADLRSGDNSWAVIGASARRAGLALGSSFGRAGRAVASRF